MASTDPFPRVSGWLGVRKGHGIPTETNPGNPTASPGALPPSGLSSAGPEGKGSGPAARGPRTPRRIQGGNECSDSFLIVLRANMLGETPRAAERPEPYFIIRGDLDQERPQADVQAEMSAWGRTVSGCPKGRLDRGPPHSGAHGGPRGAPAHSRVPAALLCTPGARQHRTPRDAGWVTCPLTVCQH